MKACLFFTLVLVLPNFPSLTLTLAATPQKLILDLADGRTPTPTHGPPTTSPTFENYSSSSSSSSNGGESVSGNRQQGEIIDGVPTMGLSENITDAPLLAEDANENANVIPRFQAGVQRFMSIFSPTHSECTSTAATGNALATYRSYRTISRPASHLVGSFCVLLGMSGLTSRERLGHLVNIGGVFNVADIGTETTGGTSAQQGSGELLGALSSRGNRYECYDLDEAGTAYLMAGQVAIDIRTDDCPNGELRGIFFPLQ